MNADGSVRTDGASSNRPTSYTPVGWTPNADAYGDAEIALSNSYGPSYWNDSWDAAKQFGGAANAVVNGAYSLIPGTFHLAREAGRGLGLFGPEEAQRFRQEMNVAGQGLRAIAKNPGTAARMAVVVCLLLPSLFWVTPCTHSRKATMSWMLSGMASAAPSRQVDRAWYSAS
jgi:hypothetical protein